MTYATFARKEADAPTSQSRSASKPAASALRIGDPNEAYEQEGDHAAAGVMSGRPTRSWSISNMKLGAAQRQPTGADTPDGPAPKPNNHDEAAKKPLIPAYPGLKESPDTGLQLPTFEPLFKPKPIHVLDQQHQLQLLAPSHAPSEAVKKEEPTPRQRKSDSGATTAGEVAASVRKVIHSPGLPLEAGTQRLMESKFEADFSDVRVHTDSKAADSAKALNARAYTFGGDITFAAGEYSPETTQGRKLLVHELTHVIQQSGYTCSSAQRAALEHEAECAAQEPSEDRKSHVAKASSGIGIACAPGEGDARQVAQALVRQMQAANKPVVVNVGGTGASHEPPDAINVNPNIVAPRKDIPNLVQAKGEEIGTLFDAGQVSKVVGNRLSPQVFDWERVASGADAVLQDGGTIEVNFRWAHEEAAESLVRALTNAGFKDVKNILNVVITAVKGSGSAPPGGGGVVPGTGAATTLSTGAGGSALKVAVAGAAAEAEGVGVGARVAGIALETAAGLVIGIAIGLFLDWLKGLIEEALLKRDLQALGPQIQTKLLALAPKIRQLQQQGSEVYSRVTVDVTRLRGSSAPTLEKGGLANLSPQGEPTITTWDNYEGAALLGVDVAGDAAPSARSEREEPVPMNVRIHAVETFSTLIDDPPRRLREKQMAEIVEKHRVKQASVPPPPAAPPSPPLLPSLAPQQAPPEFHPLPGAPGPSPLQEIDKKVEAGRNRCRQLIADGDRLRSISPSDDAGIKKFIKDESAWRDMVTYWFLYYKNNGPDDGRSKCDELLNSDQYGGKLKQVRQTFGGSPTAPPSPPLVAAQQPPPEFNPQPGAPGPSPLQEIGKKVEAGRNRCLELIAVGNRLRSTSPSDDAGIKKFIKDESAWRDMVTYWFLFYKNNGPDDGRSKCDELLNSDQYGGKLKQVRQTFGA